MASLVTDHSSQKARFGYSEYVTIDNSAKGTSIEIAAGEIAKVVVGIATEGLGLDFGSLLGTLKAGISNEKASQNYHKTQLFKNDLKLVVIHLNKTLSKKKGSFMFFSADKYEIKMERYINIQKGLRSRPQGLYSSTNSSLFICSNLYRRYEY